MAVHRLVGEQYRPAFQQWADTPEEAAKAFCPAGECLPAFCYSEVYTQFGTTYQKLKHAPIRTYVVQMRVHQYRYDILPGITREFAVSFYRREECIINFLGRFCRVDRWVCIDQSLDKAPGGLLLQAHQTIEKLKRGIG